MKVLGLFVWTIDSKTCSNQCPFLNGLECLLFHEDLEETKLSKGMEWQDNSCKTFERCNRCTYAAEEV